MAGRQEVHPDEGEVLELKQWGSLLVFSTQQGKIHGWDARMGRDAWTLTAKPSLVRLLAIKRVCLRYGRISVRYTAGSSLQGQAFETADTASA